MEIIIRKHVKELRDLLLQKRDNYPVILIEGPRQVGKTTVVTECLKGLPHLSINLEKELQFKSMIDRCEDFNAFTLWLKDQFGFIADGSKILFIDEAQESRKLGSFVRFMKEDWAAQVILTGSTMARLFRDGTRFPVGRVKTISIPPLSFSEFLGAFKQAEWAQQILSEDLIKIPTHRHEALLSLLNDYLHVGGIPPIVLAHKNSGESRPQLIEIYENYKNDFIRVFSESQALIFDQALKGIADHVGSSSKMTHVLKANEPGYKSLTSIFSHLDLWKMVLTCLQRTGVPESFLHPKRYLFDMGILYLLRTLGIPDLDIIKTDSSDHRRVLGGILENYVAIHLKMMDPELAGWKKSSAGSEIDFIIKLNNRTIPVECKASLQTKDTHLKSLKEYMQTYQLDLGVITNAAPFEKRTYPFGTIISLPLYAIEALPLLV